MNEICSKREEKIMSWDTSERRKFVRVRFPCEIALDTMGNNVIFAHTENISAGGIRVILKKRIEPAAILSLTLHKIAVQPILCKGRVMWVFTRKHDSDKEISLFDIGIEFHEISEDDIWRIKSFILTVISKRENK